MVKTKTPPSLCDLRKLETCTVRHSGNARLRIALVFPNTYYVGMSNLGFQLLYRLCNRPPDVCCERFFLPDAAQQGGQRRRMLSFESGTPLGSFDIIAFSLSFETDYLNIITMLDLAGIPPLQEHRRDRPPLLVAGGVTMFMNPEPLADLFDLIIVGEAETIIPEFIDHALKHSSGRRTRKPEPEYFAGLRGIYIPSLYRPHYDGQGRLTGMSHASGIPARTAAVRTPDLDCCAGSSCLVSPHTQFSDMALIEVSRGCPRLCRFCAVGRLYPPYRTRSFETLLAEAEPFLHNNIKIGLLGAAVSDHPQLARLMRHIVEKGGDVSISSLRADALNDEIIDTLMRCGHKTFTIAPEAATERLRNVIGKNLSESAIMHAIELLARHGVQYLRLYFMIGLPTEQDGDIEAIIELAREIARHYRATGTTGRRLRRITLSISPFVPKPFTPFQWHPFAPVGKLKKKLQSITAALRRDKLIAVKYDLPKWSFIQAVLSRGDRRAVRLLTAHHSCNGDWNRACKETSLNPDVFAYRQYTLDEFLPWDIIENGIPKQQLWESYQKALADGQTAFL